MPAHIERFYEKAIASDADIVVLDLEDGVPPNQKNQACRNISKFLDGARFGKKLLVRINPLGSIHHDSDLAQCVDHQADGIILPKINSSSDVILVVKNVLKILKKTHLDSCPIHLFPLIESAKAVLNLREIAGASELVSGLIFGHEDYLHDIGALHSKSNLNLLFARTQVVLAARERGIVPIDCAFLQIKNNKGCLQHAKNGRELGFSGMLVLHPNQVDVANEGYSPTQDEIENALEIIAIRDNAFKSNRSISFVDGKFVAPPIIKQAEAILKRAKILGVIPNENIL